MACWGCVEKKNITKFDVKKAGIDLEMPIYRSAKTPHPLFNCATIFFALKMLFCSS